jgi:fumarate reductase (CoM/CoB) subunit A
MKEMHCDVLVIGGGAAGSRAAYEAKKAYPGLNVMLRNIF